MIGEGNRISRLLSGLRSRRSRVSIFRSIYATRAWGGAESASGPGSTRDRAAAFLPDLLALVRSLDCTTLLDASCGDFHWTEPLADAVSLYIGVDVVPELIRENERVHGSPRRQFLCRDMVSDALPAADVVLCRDALVHLCNADAKKAIANLRRTGARFLIATTFIGERANGEIRNGEWRPMNLERPPFSFPPPLSLVDEHCEHTGGIYRDKRLGLWKFRDLEGVSAPN